VTLGRGTLVALASYTLHAGHAYLEGIRVRVRVGLALGFGFGLGLACVLDVVARGPGLLQPCALSVAP